MRIGQGFDVHRLVPNKPLILGGVTLECPLGLKGHSDADVLTHAVTDALLGAAALGDLGTHFPDTDDQWKEADSLVLLALVIQMLDRHGWQVVNIDSTLIAEKPKVAPYVQSMRANLAEAVGVDEDKVSVKATTTEGLGTTGRGEGMAAMAVVLIQEIN